MGNEFSSGLRIRVLDLETTGLEPTDCVVEIAAWDVNVDQGVTRFLGVGSCFVKPPLPIPPLASAVHHIVDEDVQDAAAWSETYPSFVDDSVDAYCAHNSRFDGQWLGPVLGKPLIDTYRAALRIWPDAPSHSNQGLRYFLKPAGLDRTQAAGAHRAMADAYVTAHLLALILQQPNVTLAALIACSQRPALLPRITFGKHRGAQWKDAPRDYLDWLCRQNDMSEDVRFTAKHWLGREAA